MLAQKLPYRPHLLSHPKVPSEMYRPYIWNDKKHAVQHGDPHQRDGSYLCAQGYSFVFTKVTDIRAEMLMIQ